MSKPLTFPSPIPMRQRYGDSQLWLARARVLTSRQLDQDARSEHGRQVDQCDCACPDRQVVAVLPSFRPDAVLRQSAAYQQPLPAGHTLIFNPLRDTGVAVLNAPAKCLWEQFSSPRAAQQLASEIGAAQPDALLRAVEQLALAGALEPLGAEAAPPHFAPPATLSAWMHVTNACNLRCDYCYLNKSGDHMSAEVGRAAVDAVMRSALAHNFHRVRLKFSGGEAALNLRRVFDIHEYAVRQADAAGLIYEAVILSNGVAIGERAAAELSRRGIQVMISLDGVGAAHDVQRPLASGAGSFVWVDRALSRLLSHGIRPFISITVSGRNAAALPDTVGYVLDRDLPFNLNFYRENDCAASCPDLQLQDDVVIAGILQAFAVIESRLPARSLLGMLVDRAQFDHLHDKTCGVGDSYLVIDHNGNVARCQMDIERPVTTVRAQDPLAIIRADQIGIQNLSVTRKAGCRDCEWRYWCAGGCPLLTYRATGRFDVQSPNCRIYKAVYPALLRLEGLRVLRAMTADSSVVSLPL